MPTRHSGPQWPFADADCDPHPNHLRFRVKPDDETSLYLQAKLPGDRLAGRGVDLEMSVARAFGEGPEAYERLIQDALMGDARLFARQDSVEEAWRIFDPILRDSPDVETYEQGSWGPPGARRLMLDGHHWHGPDHSDQTC